MTTIIKKSQFGDKWPFVPEKLRIQISHGAVFTIYRGVKYNLNGISENRKIGHQLTEVIWSGKSLGPIFVHLMKENYI